MPSRIRGSRIGTGAVDARRKENDRKDENVEIDYRQADSRRAGIDRFLHQLREAHPQAVIVWAYGFMIDGFADNIRQQMEKFAQTDGQTHYLSLRKIQGFAEKDANGHPNAQANRRLADELIPELEKLMGW